LTDTLPMGTHWLWHSFGAAAVQFLVLYIWRSDLHEAGRAQGEALRPAPAVAAAGD
jgi:hypothetical protein